MNGMHIDTRREGFQMTRERRRSNAEWPAWLNAAWNTPIDEPGAVYPDPNDPDRSNGRVCVNVHPDGCSRQIVEWNEWIIREADGRLWVTDSSDPTIANIEIAAGQELKQERRAYIAEKLLQTAPELAAELDTLRAELAEAKSNYIGACQTIAAMHAAAVGGIRGPNRGVVEDVADVAERLRLLELSRTDPEKSLAAHAIQLNATLRKTQEELQTANALLDGLKRPNPAAIDQVVERLWGKAGTNTPDTFRDEARRILREHFGEFGTNDRAELEKLRGYYRQIGATLGDDAVISRVRAQADTINRLRMELSALETLKTDTEAHADRLASALGWLASTCGTQVPAVVDALRAHAMRRGADFQDAGPIQSPALIPARKLPEGTALLYPGVHQVRGVICARDVIVTPAKIPDRTKLVIFDGVLFHVWQAFATDAGTVLLAAPDSAVMETDDEADAAEAMRLAGMAATDEHVIARLRAFPRPRHVGIQPKPLPTHPVDAMKAIGIPMDPDVERDLRAHCDAPVDVSAMDGGPKRIGDVLEQCGREHAEAMQRIEIQRAQLNPNPPAELARQAMAKARDIVSEGNHP
jgi:hypothetical protein